MRERRAKRKGNGNMTDKYVGLESLNGKREKGENSMKETEERNNKLFHPSSPMDHVHIVV